MPGTNLDCCIYYGIILDKNQLQSIAMYDGCKDVLEFLYKHELDYRFIGNTSYSKTMVIGKEIHWDHGSYITGFSFSENKIELDSKIVTENNEFISNNEFSKDNEEIEVLNKTLKSISSSENPRFYIVTSCE
ncbi:hypothetical protein D3C87_80220 [compost metagenome]